MSADVFFTGKTKDTLEEIGELVTTHTLDTGRSQLQDLLSVWLSLILYRDLPTLRKGHFILSAQEDESY